MEKYNDEIDEHEVLPLEILKEIPKASKESQISTSPFAIHSVQIHVEAKQKLIGKVEGSGQEWLEGEVQRKPILISNGQRESSDLNLHPDDHLREDAILNEASSPAVQESVFVQNIRGDKIINLDSPNKLSSF